MKPLSNASLEAKQCDGEEDGSLVLSMVSCKLLLRPYRSRLSATGRVTQYAELALFS